MSGVAFKIPLVLLIRKKILPSYDITQTNRFFVSWYLTDKCNFNCEYCFIQNRPQGLKQRFFGLFGPTSDSSDDTAPVDRVIAVLQPTNKPWIIGLTGGEPMVLPNFIAICEKLTNHYKIALDTNLSITSRVNELVNRIDPDLVDYIYVSTHLEERKKHNGIENLIVNLLRLKKYHFNFTVNYVLHPALLNEFQENYALFQSHGITLQPKPYKGIFDNKVYPDAYSEENKLFISQYISGNFFKKFPFPSHGLLCHAGRTMIRIQKDGRIVRCVGEKTSLGHIGKKLKLYHSGRPCRAKICSCFGADLIENPKEVFSSIVW